MGRVKALNSNKKFKLTEESARYIVEEEINWRAE